MSRAAFPVACGKTNLAMLVPPEGFEGWKVRTVGDDIAWIKPSPDGRFARSIPKPASSASRRERATSPIPTRWRPSRANTIFTNAALTDDGDVWWEGMTDDTACASDRLAGQGLDARLRPPRGASQCALHRAREPMPEHRPGLGKSRRRADLRPSSLAAGCATRPAGLPGLQLGHGVYLGATMGSEATAAADGAERRIRRDPYGDAAVLRLQHGAIISATGCTSAPPFESAARSSASTGSARTTTASSCGPASAKTCASEWIVDRVRGRAHAVESPFGWMPRFEDLRWEGLEYPAATFYELMAVGRDAGGLEARAHEEHFDKFLDRLPKEFIFERELLRSRLWRSPERWELAPSDVVRPGD